MLVLTRRAGESIVIGDDVRVVVLEVRGDTARLGIEAPRSVQVHRAEVYLEVRAANAAATSNLEDIEDLAGRLRRLARPRPAPSAGEAPASSSAPGSTAPGPPDPASREAKPDPASREAKPTGRDRERQGPRRRREARQARPTDGPAPGAARGPARPQRTAQDQSPAPADAQPPAHSPGQADPEPGPDGAPEPHAEP